MQINAKFWAKEPQNRTKRPIMERVINVAETNSTNSRLCYAKLPRSTSPSLSFHVKFEKSIFKSYVANVQCMFQAPYFSYETQYLPIAIYKENKPLTTKIQYS